MAVSDVDSFKLLNRWQETMHEQGYLFNQITGEGVPIPQGCNQNSIYIQKDRDMIANALNDAVMAAVPYLNFYPRPTYLSTRLYLQNGVPLERQPLRLPFGYLQQFGRRATTLIEADVAVTYTDANNDGVLDTATMTLTLLSDVAASEIQVFFRTADGAPDAANDLWQIEPARVTKSGLNVTITAHRSLFVKPSIWAKPYEQPNFINKFSGDVNTAGDFITLVDVYRVYTDSTNALVFNADPLLDCALTGLDGNVTFTAVGRIVDSELSTFMARRGDGCPPYLPVETIDVQYLAGLPLANGMMQRQLETALVRYSNTQWGQTPTWFCERTLNMYQWDNAIAEDQERTPIGRTNAAVEAWDVISRMAIAGGGKLTTR